MELTPDHVKVLKAVQAHSVVHRHKHFGGEITNHHGMDDVDTSKVTGIPLEALAGKPWPERKKGRRAPPMPDAPESILEQLAEEGMIGLSIDEKNGRECMGAVMTDKANQFLRDLPPSSS